MNTQPVNLGELFAGRPPEWSAPLLPAIQRQLQANPAKWWCWLTAPAAYIVFPGNVGDSQALAEFATELRLS